MEKSKAIIFAALVVVVCAGIVGAYVLYGSGSDSPSISESDALDVVLSNPNASEYYSSYFLVEDWRVTVTTLVGASPNGNTSEEGVWKVEIMERSCACSNIKPLLVIEGYVSGSTGELFEVSTKYISESEYDKETCSSTVCH
ncbi:hypothetical protein [Methanolobus sp.]|jgi:uncharacterized protein (UPF0333 family)|uniref:hypothetical protein n=1 Tax=Methanolobus sp. TaxID=1874737 RepID=UPI0025E13BD8|nr:hypothetical protein [Methanolobus sp.]